MLEIKKLTVNARGGRRLLDEVSLSLDRGEIIGLTGESGCGKTTLIRSVMGLLRTEQLSMSGEILLDGRDVTKLSAGEHAGLCGTTVALIPQSPMTAFDPSWRIDAQMTETFRLKLGMTKQTAREFAQKCLMDVNLTDTARILNSYPGQLSGGMLQRVAVAMVFGMSPKYILADEPTSALDEANCEIITELLLERKSESGILFISHDAHALQKATERMIVMHEGRIVDGGKTCELFEQPKNPHTRDFVMGACGEREEGWEWEKL